MPSQLAPIVLFVFRRPEHTRKTLEALAKNTLAKESVLHIFADGAKEGADENTIRQIAETRTILKEKQWCKEVHIYESTTNKGLADSIVSGVTDIVNQYGKIIVLEDDIVTSPYFLQYMNDALEVYKDAEKVMHIAGYLPVTNGRDKLPETFFIKYMYCWGWATWKDAWSKFNPDTQYLYDELPKRPDFNDFDIDDSIKVYEQLERNLNGTLKTWAAKWHASIFLNDGLCLSPRDSLVDNTGVEDGTGENCHCHDERWRVKYLSGSVKVEYLKDMTNNQYARDYLKRFNKYGADSSTKNKVSKKITQIRYLTFKEIFFVFIQKIAKRFKNLFK